MFVNYSSIDIFNNREVLYKNNSNNKVISWITIVILGSVVLLSISLFYKFKLYSIYNGKVIKNEKDNYIELNVDDSFFKYKNRNYYIINEKKYRCHINEIADSYYISEKKYYSVKINCDISKDININNSIVEIKVDEGKVTLFEVFVKKIKKGIKNARIKN